MGLHSLALSNELVVLERGLALGGVEAPRHAGGGLACCGTEAGGSESRTIEHCGRETVQWEWRGNCGWCCRMRFVDSNQLGAAIRGGVRFGRMMTKQEPHARPRPVGSRDLALAEPRRPILDKLSLSQKRNT